MRYFLALITSLGILFYPFMAGAANTHSAGFVAASSQRATVDSNLGITNGSITVELWFKPSSNPGTFRLFHKGNNTNHVDYTAYYLDAGEGNLNVWWTRGARGVSDPIATWVGANLATDTWYHLVFWYDGTNIKLYSAVAGGTHTERGSTAASGNGSSGGQNKFHLAAAYDGTQLTDGRFDDVRIWNIARDINDIDADFEKELVGDETNLVAYYKLNNNWEDETSNEYDLTAVNTPTFSTDVPFEDADEAEPIKEEYIILFE